MQALIPLTFQKVLQTGSYTMVVLKALEKSFAIYTEPQVGRTLQMHLSHAPKPRPFTHDLLSNICRGFNISVKHVIITDIQETTFLARIFMQQEINSEIHIVEADARPSDSLTLALLHEVPVYGTQELVEKVIPLEE